MANVLILTNNTEHAEKFTALLSPEHSTVVQSSNAGALLLIDSKPIAVIILDTCFIDNDETLLEQLKLSNVKLLLIGQNWSEQKQINALVSGAKGYCDGDAASDMLLKAVNSILHGDIWIQRYLVPKVIGALIKLNNSQSNAPSVQENKTSPLLDCLTAREMDVVKLISAGKSNKVIAEALNISERTVKAHLTSIFQKLNVQDRLHLAILIKETYR